jgi:hypothetical protein
VAIPLSEWPKHQAALESMQAAATFSSIAIRGKTGGNSTGRSVEQK